VDAVERFTELVTGRDRIPLDAGALAIAAGADPGLDADRWLAELDRLAAGVDSLDVLIRRIFVEEGFAGDTAHYYDPRNSLLHEVLARQRGIPITLSVVCIEVGRRVGVALEGVGMPGHFLLRVTGTERYVDAFTGGRPLELAECEALFRSSTGAGAGIAFGPHLLDVAPVPAILTRILQNLRAIYRTSRRYADLEWVLRMRLALPGAGTGELIELGHAMGRQGRFLDGARFLETRLRERPADSETLERAAKALRANLN
jgi:regulator of sirC expression with transglutaminase-like and TPR domain